MSKIREEVRRRFPRLTMSLVMAVIFFVIMTVVPPTLTGIQVPGLLVSVGSIVQVITVIITAIFLIRALYDALVLGDIMTDIVVRRLGIKGERSPKRAARDLIYIIVIILIATATLPIIDALEGEIKSWLTMLIIYIALGIIVILIYDIGRTLYRIIEQKAELLADHLSKLAEKNK